MTHTVTEEHIADKAYRYDSESYGDGQVYLNCTAYKIHKHTPKGFWLHASTLAEGGRFVLKGEGKRFAYTTIDAAYYGFKRRKIREAAILRGRLGHVGRVQEYLDAHPTPPKDSSVNVFVGVTDFQKLESTQ